MIIIKTRNRHVSFKCGTWLVGMRDLTHSYDSVTDETRNGQVSDTPSLLGPPLFPLSTNVWLAWQLCCNRMIRRYSRQGDKDAIPRPWIQLDLSKSTLHWGHRLDRPRMEKSHCCWPRTAWCVVNMFHKNGMRPLIITNGTVCYSTLYCNSPTLYNRLKYVYSVISVKLDWLPGSSKKWTIDLFVAFGVRFFHFWADLK